MENQLRVYKPRSSYKEDTGEKDEKGKPIYKDTYDPDALNAYEDYVKKGNKYYDPRNESVRIFDYPSPQEIVYDTLTEDSVKPDMDLLGYEENTPLPKKLGDNKETYEFLMNSPFMQKYMNYYDDALVANTRKEHKGIEDKEGYVQRFLDFAKSIIEGDEEELEKQIESHPEVAQQIAEETLGEDNSITKEAEQVNDGDGRTDEVNNEKIEEGLKEANDKEIGKFLDKSKELVDWDKVHVYEPNEDPYSRVSDESDWKDNPDYEPTDEPVMSQIHKDEDFAGPDELPATIDQIKDEDFVGHDEQLATINDGLPAEIKYDPVHDTDDYNFDWDYAVENVPELRELNDELDEEDKEEIAQLLGFKFGGKPGSLNNPPQDSQALNNIKLSKPSASLGSIGSGFLGKISSGNVNPSHVGSGVNFNTRMDSVKSIASKAPVPPEAASTSNSKAVAGSNNNLPHSNGTVGSGAGMMFQKRNSDLKVKGSNLPDLGGPHHQSEIEETNVDDIVENMSEGLIETLEKLLNEHPELGEQLGFDHKYKHWAFNGISLDKLPIDKITSLTNSLRRLV